MQRPEVSPSKAQQHYFYKLTTSARQVDMMASEALKLLSGRTLFKTIDNGCLTKTETKTQLSLQTQCLRHKVNGIHWWDRETIP
jgi:hypothetical protein